MTPGFIGGSFAPPIDAAKLANYEALADTAPEQIKEAMTKLIAMCHEYFKHPETLANEESSLHPSGIGIITPLQPEVISAIDRHVPWLEELKMYGIWFDSIDPISQRELRNAAHHLLWFGNELFLDRQPLTADKL